MKALFHKELLKSACSSSRRCRQVPRSGPKCGLSSCERPVFAMNFIQPSLCPYRNIEREYYYPEDIARCEAWMYGNLASKQGLTVPYFFGIHTAVTPSQEPAWVLVLEYIGQGQSLHDYAESPEKTFEDVCDLQVVSLKALADVTSDGFHHYDIGSHNIFITGAPPHRIYRLLLRGMGYHRLFPRRSIQRPGL
ncbi:hypothetical protein B0H10DRAFT_253259 [Mycena sp. CBHHK59/15]|nr:hypothetical protein B0H10DRAFT_253259 [Mycena sp. CBHHK59/15]